MQESLDNEAHIWIAYVKEHNIPWLLVQYKALLSDYEIGKYNRFYFKRHSKSYLVSHALLRTTLSRYSSVLPAQWIFSQNSYGHPCIHSSGNRVPLQFNISRTEHAAVCVITSDIDCGIDIESQEKLDDLDHLSIQVLSPMELGNFRHIAADAKKERFLTYWTLKESYVKALGIGLSIPLQNISFMLDTDGDPKLMFHPETSVRPSDWQFTTIKLPNEHLMSVALRKGMRPDLNLRINVVRPGLTSYLAFNCFLHPMANLS